MQGPQFQILGAVRAVHSAEDVYLGPPQQRCVLALLLLDVGRLVHVERLIDLLWGDTPPRGARTTVQVYVSKLRKVLSELPEVKLISASGPCYQLEVDPDRIDIHRFRKLVARAGSAKTNEQASDLLQQALELWTGPALDDVAPAHLRSTLCASLAEEHLAALEQRIDADLRLGRFSLLIPELTDLVRRHPMRERITAQLMTALYSDGRRADALAQYQQLRRVLAEELGVDPTPQLDELNQAILRDDPEIAGFFTPATTDRHVRLPVPAQLPADLHSFTGRTEELHLLLDLMPTEEHERPDAILIAAIDGMAGIGKTTLAVHAAHSLAPLFPDGQLFIDLHGFTEGVKPVDPADALDRVLRSLGVPGEQIPAGLDDRAALYRSILAGQRMLIVLDDAATESQVKPLLPGTPGCLAVITSRRRLSALDDVRPVTLDVFPPGDAATFFAIAAGQERIAGEPPGLVSEIIELCGRLPLAVRIAAARLSARPAWTLRHLGDRLRDHQHRLAELESGERSVRAALDLSYEQLDTEEQKVFALLGVHPGPDFDPPACAALAGLDPVNAGRVLDRLLDAHLLQQQAEGRYDFHDLVRAYAAHLCDIKVPEDERARAVGRLLDYFARGASVAMDAIYPANGGRRPHIESAELFSLGFKDNADATAWLDVELDNILALAQHAGAHGRSSHLQHISATLHHHLHATGRYTEALALHKPALEHARRKGDRIGELRALLDLGKVHRMQEQTISATDCFDLALTIAREMKDRPGQIDALIGLGYIRSMSGWYTEAAEYLGDAYTLTRAAGDHTSELAALIGLGFAHNQRRRYPAAAEYYELALDLACKVGSRIDELSATLGLGTVNRGRGRFTAASGFFERALKLSRSPGTKGDGRSPQESGLGLYRQGEFNALIGLGDVHRQLGRYDQAIDSYRQVLRLACLIGNRNYQFEALEGLGVTCLATGDVERAVSDLQDALELARDLNQHTDEVRALHGLAQAYRLLGKNELAREHWQQTVHVLTRLGISELEELDIDEVRAHLAAL